MKRENEENVVHNENDATESANQCLTFTSHELFWKELQTIVEDAIDPSDQ